MPHHPKNKRQPVSILVETQETLDLFGDKLVEVLGHFGDHYMQNQLDYIGDQLRCIKEHLETIAKAIKEVGES